MAEYTVEKETDAFTSLVFQNEQAAKSAQAALMLTGVEGKSLQLVEQGDPSEGQKTTWALTVSGEKSKDTLKRLGEGQAAIEKFCAFATTKKVSLVFSKIKETDSGAIIRLGYTGTAGEPSADAAKETQRLRNFTSRDEVSEILTSLRKHFPNAGAIIGGDGQVYVEIPVDAFNHVSALNGLSQVEPKKASTFGIAGQTKKETTSKIAVKPAVPETQFTIEERAIGDIVIHFENTKAGQSRAAETRALLLMLGKDPQTFGYVKDADAEAKIGWVYNPDVTIQGLKKDECESFYKEWFSEKGKIARMQNREDGREAGYTVHPIPTIRIRSTGDLIPAFIITAHNIVNPPHQKTIAALRKAQLNVDLKVAGDPPVTYIDIQTAPGQILNLLDKNYFVGDLPSISTTPAKAASPSVSIPASTAAQRIVVHEPASKPATPIVALPPVAPKPPAQTTEEMAAALAAAGAKPAGPLRINLHKPSGDGHAASVTKPGEKATPEQQAAATLEQKLRSPAAIFANGMKCTVELPNETNPGHYTLKTQGYFPAGCLAGMGFVTKKVMGMGGGKPLEFQQYVTRNDWTIAADVMQYCFPSAQQSNAALLGVLHAIPGLEKATVELSENSYTLKNLGEGADPAKVFTGEFAPYAANVAMNPCESIIYIGKEDMMRVMGQSTTPPR